MIKNLKSYQRYFRTVIPLFTASFLVLFLEMLIIRLVGTEIRIFAYLSNLTLLAIFIGSGVGMLLKKKIPVEVTTVLLFLLTVVLSMQYVFRFRFFDVNLFSGITDLLSPLAEDVWKYSLFSTKTSLAIGFSMLTLVVVLISSIFIPLGQYIGEIFKKDKNPLMAYSINVFASIVGMWAFYILSFLRITPMLGIILAQFLLILISKTNAQKCFVIAILAATIALTLPTKTSLPGQGVITYWSPYQKLSLFGNDPSRPAKGYFLQVNNTGYMTLLDLGVEYRERLLKQFNVSNTVTGNNYQFTNHYDLPYILSPEAKSVLIIGSGGGNDVAAAVRARIPKIDAVEIDPVIIEIGQRFHPERPYGPAVNVIVDDGRAYLTRTKIKYDIIIMALADSHTLNSSLTNLRLDNYLYTLESLSRAKQLLTNNGIMLLDFEVRRGWVGGHLNETLKEAFGHLPTIFEVRSGGYFGDGGVIFATARNSDTLANKINSVGGLKKFVEANQRLYPPAGPLTDDWPYLYFPVKTVPTIHLIVAGIIIAILAFSRLFFMKRGQFKMDFFFLGAAFLLYEFQNVSKTSLLFGNTWITNLFTITSILILILIANGLVSKVRISPKIVYVLLAISLVGQFILPLSLFDSLSFWPKVVVSSFILNIPLLFAGIIFAQKFEKTKDRNGALGSNLIGSAIGGLAEMFSFIFGVQALIIGSIIFYMLSYLFSDK